MNDIKSCSNRYVFKPSPDGLVRLGIYENYVSHNLFYSAYNGIESLNRIKPSRVWLDEDGCICVEIERRKVNRS